MKRPSFQFYPSDWQANSNLRRCTHEEKGIWMDVMCLLHDQEEYGVCRWPLKEIAQAVGISLPKIKGIVTKGVLKGADTNQDVEPLIYIPRSGRKDGAPVTLIPAQKGPLWYSSRMVVDEYKRVLRGDLGGTPKATPNHSPKGGLGDTISDTPKATPNPAPFTRAPGQAPRAAPSSSSSSSSKTLKPLSGVHGSPEEGEPNETVAAASGSMDDGNINPADARASQIANVLRAQGMRLNSSDPNVLSWADRGATDEQIVEAYEIAVSRRSERGDPSPINTGYIDKILGDVLAPKQAKRKEPPWWSSRQSIEAKGRELGMTARSGEDWDSFKARIQQRISEEEAA